MNISAGIISTIAFIGAVAAYTLLPVLSSHRLTLVEQWVSWRYVTPSITSEELQKSLDSTDTLIFDVRSNEEYAVSHLPSAINVDPQLTADKFLQRFGDQVKNKRLVFYCSVGQRSSALADKVRESYPSDAEVRIVNLRGGIFRWATDGRPMENQQGKTPEVHPYSKQAAILLPAKVNRPTAVTP